MTGDVPARVAEALEATADLARTVRVDDWDRRDCEMVLPKLTEVAVEAHGLAARIRVVLAGGFERCHEPPDLAGLCMRCGQGIAPPVAAEKPGCNPIPRRVGVRVWRLARTLIGDLRGTR